MRRLLALAAPLSFLYRAVDSPSTSLTRPSGFEGCPCERDPLQVGRNLRLATQPHPHTSPHKQTQPLVTRLLHRKMDWYRNLLYVYKSGVAGSAPTVASSPVVGGVQAVRRRYAVRVFELLRGCAPRCVYILVKVLIVSTHLTSYAQSPSSQHELALHHAHTPRLQTHVPTTTSLLAPILVARDRRHKWHPKLQTRRATIR
ncbi:hypothetical protein BC629DRAFT_1571943 [Irpex lacteus]|nr:hypothetical protein BC629DRAFT_1573258 [Irpex lacteus]KAI0733693.1 hypothetical protein BC629DRAFT_1571943 [Irpex lacteus]